MLYPKRYIALIKQQEFQKN
ncbi:hypothetical protein VTP01DRAFT_4435 [Rhizomucor pusillus]